MASVMRVSSKEWRQLVQILSNLKAANDKVCLRRKYNEGAKIFYM